MSFSNESLMAKLDALQETQDSIVSTSTWVLFHYRYADRIASEWEKYLYAAAPHRKLSVIYLANDVVQQARARKRTEFLDAFYKVLPESLANAYKKVPPPVQQRIAKLVNVLKERNIFSQPLNVPGINSNATNGSSASSGSEDEKLKALASSGQKFHRFYHELLISANGTFTNEQLPYLQRLRLMIKENIGQLQDLEDTLDTEVGKTEERSKAAKEKLEELKRKQAELEEQKRQDEIKRQEELRRQEEEDRIVPTYAADSDDDDKSSDSDNDSDSDDDAETQKKSDDEGEAKKPDTPEDAQDAQETLPEAEAEPAKKPPKKKLRFA